MSPVAIIKGALETIAHENEQHQEIMFNAVRDELNRYQGGCPCEQLARKHGGATNVVATVFHSTCNDFAQVKTMRDSETLAGQGKTVAEAMRDLHD